MLECSIIACILGIIIFFIIGIKCTFPARHQKRKSPARRPGGFEIRRKKGSTYENGGFAIPL